MEQKDNEFELLPTEPGVSPANDIQDLDNRSASGNGEEEIQPADTSSAPEKRKKKRHGRWILGAIFLGIVITGIAIWLGYQNGVARRIDNQQKMVIDQVSQQLELAYADIASGAYENAEMRLKYILEISPGFPTAEDLLVEARSHLVAPNLDPVVATNTPSAPGETPAGPTPTPDLQQAAALFAAIQQNITNSEWGTAIENIEEIKEYHFDYQPIAVDGYYFIALRNHGLQEIWAGQLEQGMFELSMAEALGALDGDAAGAYNWASLYIRGASYWDVNWQAAVDTFGQIYPVMPYFSDASGMSVAERYRIALYSLGDLFAAQGNFCEASSLYQQSLSIGTNLDIQVTATAYAEYCANPPTTETPPPIDDGSPTPTAPADVTPEPPPTEEPTPQP